MGVAKNKGALSQPVYLTEEITATLNAADIEIGAVELKNGTTDTRGTVLAASTAAVATDTALVVALHPSSPLGAGTAIIGKIGIDQTTPGTTNFVQNKEMPDSTATFAVTPSFSTAAEASRIAKASAGNLLGFSFVNGNAATRYVQVFNSATLPADAAVPVMSFPVATGATFAFDSGKFPNQFSAGITLCNSSTQLTKTIGSADSLFYIQYV